MPSDSKFNSNVKALIARKEFLFKELSRIYDLVKRDNFNDEIEADIQLSVLNIHETTLNELIKEILTINTLVEKGEEITTKDFNTFRIQIDAIRKCCLKCKLNSSQHISQQSEAINLPRINLPIFSGDISEWNAFIEQYNATVHSKNISKIEKLTYLRSILKKEPLSIVNQYELKETSYDLAYNALTGRYANPRLLANYYLNQILNYKNFSLQLGKPFMKFMEVHRAATSCLLNLEIDNLAEYLLFELVYRNLPLNQQKTFDREFDSVKLPKLSDLFSHIENIARSEELHSEFITTKTKSNFINKNQQVLLGVSDDNKIRICVYCKNSHPLFRCKIFGDLPLTKKLEIVKKYGVCHQCLGTHKNVCFSKYNCKYCHSKNHHSFLCKKFNENNSSQLTVFSSPQLNTENSTENIQKSCNACLSSQKSTVLLGTIKAQVTDIWGFPHNVKIVCDTGSQVNIVTNSLVKRLGLKRFRSNFDIQSVSQSTPKVLGSVNINIQSPVIKNINYEFNAVILPSICSSLPNESLNIELSSDINNLPLADPEFFKSQSIDILLGADACMDIMSTEEPTIIKNYPTAINTIFGYVLTGRVNQNQKSKAYSFCTTTLDKTLRSFWEVENVETSKQSVEDIVCEEHFTKTYQRDPTGRYIVRLPFQSSAPPMGTNLEIGLRSFLRLENRFKKQPELLKSYSAIIQDYLDQGHMSPVTINQQYILPHHCVYKDSSSTAVRVVFNASCPDDTGFSLNSRLNSGPKLQNELPRLLISFRFHEIALQADIKQMFRNILLHSEDRRFQHILWRWFPDEKLKQFSLNTVTFGFTSSPYLAQRVLKQLVKDEGSLYPEASESILYHTFMDDFVTGASTVEAAKKLHHDLTDLLSKGGFELRKWSTSHPEVLDQLPEEHKEKPFIFPTGEEGVKILGLLWDKTSDSLRYHVTEFQASVVTKRSVLSYIARIWDCLGLVSPIVLKTKIFLQRLWLLQVDWDEELPSSLSGDWLNLVSEMPMLEKLKIPRKLPVNGNQLCLVGFSDASESAMAANVYLRITFPNNKSESHLIMSKTKLAPLKTWTIPRLELSAAVLLTSIIDYVRQSKLQQLPVYLFTDSQIVLAWLRLPPHNLKIFVANRVIQIKETLPDAIWNFVPGDTNPADLSSRGLKPSQILENNLWWNGPEFLKQSTEEWSKPSVENFELQELPEIKTSSLAKTLVTQISVSGPVTDYISKPSSFTKLQRVVAFILRFISNVRNSNRLSGPLSSEELKKALLTCVKLTQEKYFYLEMIALEKSKEVSKGLQTLSPFLDSKHLLRAGGRIRRAQSLHEDAKHPLILPKNCHLSSLICDFYHISLLHAGPKTTMSAIQQKFWIISLKQLLKKRIRLCLRCYKLSSVPKQPLMGELPHERVNISRPFTNITVDFGGPITTKESRLRSSVRHKSYICIFVCMAVKAVHIEAVSELSTKAFLAAFVRFSSRRGLPQKVFSDCGRNFVGAARELKENFEKLKLDKASITSFAANKGVDWSFSPPHGPNFNGLAEAAIKSTKTLLIRQIGEEVLTFEEFSTLLCRIEAVLNSRPLTITSTDPSENSQYLSPAHFLIGDQILFPPEIATESLSIKDRWQQVQKMSLLFWKKWSKDYLNTLLQRQRWTKTGPNLREGQIVFISGENLSPLQWPIGRVVALHTGEDGIARVATIKTGNRELRRPVSKLLTLPEDQ